KYAQKQHKMANLEVESDRLKKHQTPPHQQKTRNQQHKMAYKPIVQRKREGPHEKVRPYAWDTEPESACRR
ncbi:hypothetical protein, partial [Trueperella pyogenes]